MNLMKWFKPSKKDQELMKLLKNSISDFEFDPNKVKYRLLSSLNQAEQKPLIRHFRIGRVAQYSVGFAGLVVLISTTFAFASSSKPGDKLFMLNKFGENVVLKLPLSVEQNAKVQEYIVTNRLKALDQVKPAVEEPDMESEFRNLETIKESDESLMTAVNQITENKKKLEALGRTQAAENLEKVLDQLQTQAEKRQAKIRELEENSKDSKTKAEIRNYLQKIENSRKKAQSEIRRYQELEKERDANDSEDDDDDD